MHCKLDSTLMEHATYPHKINGYTKYYNGSKCLTLIASEKKIKLCWKNIMKCLMKFNILIKLKKKKNLENYDDKF